MLCKYPQTKHLPFSLGMQSDDKRILTLDGLIGHEVVVTIKKDGENTSMYSDRIHARSLDSRHHPSRDWVKAYWSKFKYLIPGGWRICGENVYAQHSIVYEDLESYFYGFSVWDQTNTAISWDDTLAMFDKLGIIPVPVLYSGPFDIKVLETLAKNLDTNKTEGFVVRVTDAFSFDDFDTKVAKWVRKGHVQTDKHWMAKEVIPNRLKTNVCN